MSIFETVKIYATPWNPVEERALTAEEKAEVASAEVTKGDYGLSVCFHLTTGGMCFFSIDTDNSKLVGVGDKVDVDNLIYKKLEKKDVDGTMITCDKVIIQ